MGYQSDNYVSYDSFHEMPLGAKIGFGIGIALAILSVCLVFARCCCNGICLAKQASKRPPSSHMPPPSITITHHTIDMRNPGAHNLNMHGNQVPVAEAVEVPPEETSHGRYQYQNQGFGSSIPGYNPYYSATSQPHNPYYNGNSDVSEIPGPQSSPNDVKVTVI